MIGKAVIWGMAFLAAVSPCSVLAADDLSGTPELYAFMGAISEATANAKIRGTDQKLDKVITISRNESKELVVTSLSVLPGMDPLSDDLSAATVAVARWHVSGQCELPQKDDAAPVAKGLIMFISGRSGRTIWEIGKVSGVISIRQVKSPKEFGPWEPFQDNAANYSIYHCNSAQ